jgi:hypothetical protein
VSRGSDRKAVWPHKEHSLERQIEQIHPISTIVRWQKQAARKSTSNCNGDAMTFRMLESIRNALYRNHKQVEQSSEMHTKETRKKECLDSPACIPTTHLVPVFVNKLLRLNEMLVGEKCYRCYRSCKRPPEYSTQGKKEKK